MHRFLALNIATFLGIIASGPVAGQGGDLSPPLKFEIPSPMSKTVNTDKHHTYLRFAPSGDRLLYTKQAKTGHEAKGVSPMDVYEIDRSAEGSWQPPNKDVNVFNIQKSNEIVGISKDEKHIYLLDRDDKGHFAGISLRRFINGKWTPPEKVPFPEFKHPPIQMHVYIHDLENVAIIAMKAKHAFGKLDLYVSQKNQYGAWGELINLGSKINSKGDEYSAWLSEDQHTIFFSSNGHYGLGGADIFKSSRLNDSWTHWSEPENLGNRINSTGDDVGFSMNPKYEATFLQHAASDSSVIYKSSLQPTIYTRHLFKRSRWQPTAVSTERPKLKGLVETNNEEFVTEADIYIINNHSSDMKILKPDIQGRFHFDLEPENTYIVRVVKEGYFTNESVISTMGKNNGKTFNLTFFLEKSRDVVVENTEDLVPIEEEVLGEEELKRQKESEYWDFVNLGDLKFNAGKFTEAKAKYEKAISIMPEKTEARHRLEKLKKRQEQDLKEATALADNKSTRHSTAHQQKEEEYKKYMKDGYNAFVVQDYKNSLSAYQLAHELKPNAALPKKKIKEIKSLLEPQDVEVHEEAVAARKDQKKETHHKQQLDHHQINVEYKKSMKEGYNAFIKKDYDEALAAYQRAHELKPNSHFPKKKLKEINEIMLTTNEASDIIARDKARMEKEREAKENETIVRNDAAEKERLAAEAKEKEHLEKLEEEKKEAARLEKLVEEKKEAERLAKLEEEKKEAARLAKFEEEKNEAARLAKLEEEKNEAARLAKLEEEKKEAARLTKLEEEKKEKERLTAEAKKAQEAIAKLEEEKKEAARLAKLEKDKKEAARLAAEVREQERLAKLEEERKAKEALAKLEEEKKEAARLTKLEEERKEKERLAKLEEERKEKERLTKLEEAKKKEEARLAAEAKEKERLAKIEEERKAKEALAKLEEERKKKEEAARLAAEAKELARQAKLEEEKKEAERLAKLEEEKKEAARLAKLEEEKKEAERLAKLEEEKKEVARLAKLEEEKKEAERLAKIEEEKLVKEATFVALIKRGEDLVLSKDFHGAENNYKEASKLKPGDPRLLTHRKDLDQAIAKAEEDKKRREEEQRLAELEAQRKAKEEAARKAKEQRFNELVNSGNLAFAMKKYEDARGEYNKALTVKPNDPMVSARLKELDVAIAKAEEEKKLATNVKKEEHKIEGHVHEIHHVPNNGRNIEIHETTTVTKKTIVTEETVVTEKEIIVDGENDFISLEQEDLSGSEMIVRGMEENPHLHGIVLDNESNLPLKAALVYLINQSTSDTKKLMSLADGKFNFDLEKDSKYKIKVVRRGYDNFEREFSTAGLDGHDALKVEVKMIEEEE